MFGSSLPPVVCKRAHCLTYLLFVFVCAIVVSNTYGIVFLFYFSSSCVPYVASFYGLYILIITSVFSNVYIVHFDYHFGCSLTFIYNNIKTNVICNSCVTT